MPDRLPLPPRPAERHLRPGGGPPPVVGWVLVLSGSAVLCEVLDRLVPGGRSRDWVAGAMLGAGVAAAAWYVARRRRFNAANAVAVALMMRGRLAEAALELERNARAFGGLGRAASVHNLAVVRLKQGEPGIAVRLFGALARSRFARRAPLGRHLPVFLSLGLCLEGDLAGAEAWLAEARRRASGGLEGLAEAALRCRQGRYAEAVAVLKAGGEEVVGRMPPDFACAYRVLGAFALERLERPPGEVAALLAESGAGGAPGFLGAAWPEMAQFLSRHGLTGAV